MSNLVDLVKEIKTVEQPDWAKFVKTGAHVERPPMQDDWWYLRVASLLNKVNKFGPIGTNRLSKHYGGRKNRGHKPDQKTNAGRKIIRVGLQQLEAAGLIKSQTGLKAGKVLTKEGAELLKKVNK
ncbi:MAG: 40S ribosomal protein S19 [Nanoarchaeota archaeon]|nr:40S ribosomal protein S19 [Nanoarchaeota archaeon]